jgi:hypothetical protein
MTDPWKIGSENNRQTSESLQRRYMRNNELEDQLTQPARTFANNMASGAANRQNAVMNQELGFNTSASGNPVTPQAPSRRFNTQLPVNREFFDEFMTTVQTSGLTNPYGLAAVAATGQAESGWGRVFDEWNDPSGSGQPGRSGLSMSWRNERLQAAREFARRQGDDPNRPSARTQALFMAQEDPTLFQRLNNARSQEEAINIMRDAWRYHDPDGSNTRNRLMIANNFVRQFGGNRVSNAQFDRRFGEQAQATSSDPVMMTDESGRPYQLVLMPQSRFTLFEGRPQFAGVIEPDMQATLQAPRNMVYVRYYGTTPIAQTPDVEEAEDNDEDGPPQQAFDPWSGS